jgi:hypothetical protein
MDKDKQTLIHEYEKMHREAQGKQRDEDAGSSIAF